MKTKDRVKTLTKDLDVKGLATMLRACLMAPKGKRLVVADWSQVEARYNAWAAGDEDALHRFRLFDAGDKVNGDPYVAAACSIYGGKPREYFELIDGKQKLTKDAKPKRQIGKSAELGCFGAATEVLTRRGWVPIIAVTTEDRLWDGIEWVAHRGLVPRGLKETINLAGVEVTPDHLVWVGAGLGWASAGHLARDENTLRRSLATASGALRCPDSFAALAEASSSFSCGATAVPPSTKCSLTTCSRALQQVARRALGYARGIGSSVFGSMRTWCRTTRIALGCSTAYPRSCSGARIVEAHNGGTTEGEASRCTRHGLQTARRSFATWLRSKGGTSPRSNSTDATTTADTSPETCGSSHGASTAQTDAPFNRSPEESQSLRPVFDLAHAGPRNRYTVRTERGPIVVHNCGYGMGADGFEAYAIKNGADWPKLYPITPKDVVTGWRELHHPIVSFWYEMNDCAADVTENGGEVQCGPYTWAKIDGLVVLRLPSGRLIAYQGMQVSWVERYGRMKPELRYLSKRGLLRTFGGSLVENATQGACACELRRAVVECERIGLPVVLTVHDEVVCEVDERDADDALEALLGIMQTVPGYIEGLPLGATGYHADRYRKE